MLNLLLKLKDFVTLFFGIREIFINKNDKSNESKLLPAEALKDEIEILKDEIIGSQPIQELSEKERKFREFILFQHNEIEKLHEDKQKIVNDIKDLNNQLTSAKDKFLDITKEINNSTKFIKKTAQYLGNKK